MNDNNLNNVTSSNTNNNLETINLNNISNNNTSYNGLSNTNISGQSVQQPNNMNINQNMYPNNTYNNIPPNNINNQNLTGVPNNKKSNKKLIIILIVVLLIVICLVVYFTQFYHNSKKVFTTTISSLSKSLNNTIESSEDNFMEVDYANKIYDFSGDFKISSNYNEDGFDLTNESKYKYNYDVQVNAKDNKIYYNLGIDKLSSKVINLEGIMDNSYFYFNFPGIVDSVYKTSNTYDIDLSKLTENGTITRSELVYFINKTEESLNEYLNNYEYTSREDEINGKKAYVSILTLNPKTKSDIYNKLISDYKSDDKALSTIKKLGVTDDDLKEKDEDDFTSTEVVELKTINNKLVNIRLFNSDKNTDYLNVDVDNNLYTITIYLEDTNDIVLKYDTDTKTLTTNYDYNNSNMDIKIVFNNSNIDYDINVTSPELDGKINLNGTIKFKSSKIEENINILLNLDYNGTTASLELNSNMKEIDKLKDYNTSNTVLSYTDDEISKIESAIKNGMSDSIVSEFLQDEIPYESYDSIDSEYDYYDYIN